MELRDASVIVTGAGRGIGASIARVIAAEGARVVCASIEEDVEGVAAGICAAGGQAVGVVADITKPDDIARMTEAATAHNGHVDLLVNNAATILSIGAVWEADAEAWKRDLEVNLLGPFLSMRHILPMMIERGSGIIVSLAGGGYDVPNPGLGGYAAAKAGLMRLIDTLAVELAQDEHDGVQVFGMWPGFVNTGMTQRLAAESQGQRWLPHVKGGFEAGEDHPPEDVGHAIVRLVQMACPELNGRIFSYDDDYDAIDPARVASEDLRQLRLRPEG